jgi:hypothetical protein
VKVVLQLSRTPLLQLLHVQRSVQDPIFFKSSKI